MNQDEIEAERTRLENEMDRALAEYSKALEVKNRAVEAMVQFEALHGKGDA